MATRKHRNSTHGFSEEAMELSRAGPVKAERLADFIQVLDDPETSADEIDSHLESAAIMIEEGFLDRRDTLDRLFVPAIYALNEPQHIYDLLENMRDTMMILAGNGHVFGRHAADPLLFQSLADGLVRMSDTDAWARKSGALSIKLVYALSPLRGHDVELIGLLHNPQRNSGYAGLPPRALLPN